jgi:hypothetical protein
MVRLASPLAPASFRVSRLRLPPTLAPPQRDHREWRRPVSRARPSTPSRLPPEHRSARIQAMARVLYIVAREQPLLCGFLMATVDARSPDGQNVKIKL